MTNERSSAHIIELIRRGESLTLEFKSDAKGLPDRDLVAAVVALANTEGGDLLLGVEDDGRITGLHPNHQNLTGLPALIANKTIPPLTVRVEAVETKQGTIARIMVQKSRQLVSTSEGMLQRRRLMADGKPEAVPFYPHEFVQRQSAMGLADPSAMLMEGLSVDDLNPLERHRIREAIRKYGGDQSLLPLKVYRTTGQKAAYIRQAGFDPIQQEQMVLNYIDKHGSIKRAEAMDLCRISKDQAYKLLNRLKDSEKIEKKRRKEGGGL